MKIVCTGAEYIALLDRFETDVTVIEKGDERIYRGVNTLYGVPVEVEDGNTVRVVRCKDCKYAELFPYLNRMFCKCPDIHRFGLSSFEVSENHFCGYGERKEDAN